MHFHGRSSQLGRAQHGHRYGAAGVGTILVTKTQIFRARCLVPGFDGAVFSRGWRDALWVKFAMRRATHSLGIKLHQQLRRKANLLAQRTGVRTLLDQFPKGDLVIGHWWGVPPDDQANFGRSVGIFSGSNMVRLVSMTHAMPCRRSATVLRARP